MQNSLQLVENADFVKSANYLLSEVDNPHLVTRHYPRLPRVPRTSPVPNLSQLKEYPMSGHRPLQSILFELRHDSSKEVAECGTEGLALTESKFFPNNGEHFKFSGSQIHSDLLNPLLQCSALGPKLPSLLQQPENNLKLRRNDDIVTTESLGSVTESGVYNPLTTTTGIVPDVSESKALPLEWVLNPDKSSLAAHVVAYLIVQEAKEGNPHLRDDLRISQLTLIHLERGDAVQCSAFVLATYEVLGCHPEQVWQRISARRAANLGRAGAGERPSLHAAVLTLPGISISANSAVRAVMANQQTQLGAEANVQSVGSAHSAPVLKKPVQSIPSSQVRKEEA